MQDGDTGSNTQINGVGGKARSRECRAASGKLPDCTKDQVSA